MTPDEIKLLKARYGFSDKDIRRFRIRKFFQKIRLYVKYISKSRLFTKGGIRYMLWLQQWKIQRFLYKQLISLHRKTRWKIFSIKLINRKQMRNYYWLKRLTDRKF